MTELRSLTVPEGLDGLRLDTALARLFGFSRSRAADLAEEGSVSIDGVAAGKAERVNAGATLEVRMPPAPASIEQTAPKPVSGLIVLYADNDIVVVDKPVGVAAHASPGWNGPTVIAGLAAMGHTIATSGAAERQGVVHRLDVGTSGLMVVAKSEIAYSVLKDAFRNRSVDKHYHALAQGHLDPVRGTIDAPIGRHHAHDWKFSVMAEGKPSTTHYATIEAFRAASLLDVRLETGRTHQIRVHLAAVRHPCVGDLTYGADPVLAARLGLTRQWLHANRLAFRHPTTGDWVEFDSDYPADLTGALQKLEADH